MKIAYCIGSLEKAGGTEKVLSSKVNYFVANLGFEIHIIINNQGGKPIYYEFSENIIFHDMGSNQFVPKLKIKGVSFWFMIKKLRKVYERIFLDIKPDVIIVCERGFDDYVIPYICKSIPKVREFHFAKGAVKSYSKIINPLIDSLIYRLRYFSLFHQFNKYDRLVLLTQKDQLEGKYKTKTIVIPNMIDFEKVENKANLDSKNVISVGSMYDDRKQFGKQIKIWEQIVKKHPDWTLHIYGEGAKRPFYQELINSLNLNEHIILHGNSNNMSENYLAASFFIFTSLAEGLPMVLLEAQMYGLPCISFDCSTGPSDIIEDGVNGYLIKENDIYSFIDKTNKLIEDSQLRILMGKSAIESSKKFFPPVIANKWISFFNEITENKKYDQAH
jgi:glycosyltransferase involved in cell wall biosynthesis